MATMCAKTCGCCIDKNDEKEDEKEELEEKMFIKLSLARNNKWPG